MVRQPERRCVPVEVEPVPLYRESSAAARRRRQRRRERRRTKGARTEQMVSRRSLRDLLNQRWLWRVSRR